MKKLLRGQDQVLLIVAVATKIFVRQIATVAAQVTVLSPLAILMYTRGARDGRSALLAQQRAQQHQSNSNTKNKRKQSLLWTIANNEKQTT